jgi:hypothetical protein
MRGAIRAPSRALAISLALACSALLMQPPRANAQASDAHTNPTRQRGGLLAQAQAPAPKAAQEKGKWIPLFERHAGEYVVRAGLDAKEDARRLAEPVLRWWQPVRGGDDGALYLWVRDGRPVAAVTFFTFKLPEGTRWVTHEHHSFAAEPVEATWKHRVVWRTSRPGLEFKPVPDAPLPASTPPARLRQMQALVRDFSANTVDDKGSKWPLRPLVTPLYRYEGKTDGVLCALVQGTDPEAFVLLEVRGEGTDARWQFAAARFTDLELHVRYKDREVFSGPHSLGGPDQIYHSSSVIGKPSDSPEDFN